MRGILYVFSFILINFAAHSQSELETFRSRQKAARNYSCDELIEFAGTFRQEQDSGYYYYLLGKAQLCSSEYRKSFESYSKSLEKFGNRERMIQAEIKIEMGTCLSIMNHKDEALRYFLEIKKVCETNADSELRVKLHLALGEFYRKYAQFDRAELELRKGYQYVKKDLFLKASYLNRLAALKTETTQLDSSLYYSYWALSIANALKNNHLIATSQNEIAYILRHQNKLDEAMKRYQQATAHWRKAGMNLYALDSKVAIGVIMDDSKNAYRSRKRLFLNCLKEAHDNRWHLSEIYIYPHLMDIYEALGKKDSVDYYFIEKMRAEIRYLNAVNETNSYLIQKKYEQEKNHRVILRQKEKIRNAQKQVYYYFILISGIFVILSLVTYILYRQLKEKKRIFAEKIREEEKNRQLEIILNEKNALVKEVHHRVKNNLQIMEAMIHLQLQSTNHQVGKQALEEISRRLKAMSLVHEMIYSHESLEKIALDNYLKRFLEVTGGIFDFSNQNLEHTWECEPIHLGINKTMAIGIILSEMINNSIKYAFSGEKNPQIAIRIKKVEKQSISMTYMDNGIGFARKEIKKGLGLNLIDIFSRQLNGAYTIQAEKGFTYTINFPHGN